MTRSERARAAAGLQAAGFRGEILPEASLAPYTTWRIGGPAELLATPTDEDDLLLALRWAARSGSPWRVLGNGSNLLVREQGVRGLVLRIRRVMDRVTRDGEQIVCGAGASLPAVARFAAHAGLQGIEFGVGIPGTVGGALVMNAGWHEFEIGRQVSNVRAVGIGGIVNELSREECRFRYRGSRFRDGPEIVLEATLHLEPGDSDTIQSRIDAFAASRKEHQPTELPSCGSVFLKPPGDFAGRLIERAGLKGARVGDIEVSTKHANFFVNRGRATANDVLELVVRVERVVQARFGVQLEREFEIW